jgi:hypothetical protein
MRHLSRKVVLVVAAIAAAVMAVASQTPPAQKPSFEVASVKPTKIRGPINETPGGRFIAAGQSLRGLIGNAYRLRDFQIIGGPSWVDTDLWEIQAKAGEGNIPPPSGSQLRFDRVRSDLRPYGQLGNGGSGQQIRGWTIKDVVARGIRCE